MAHTCMKAADDLLPFLILYHRIPRLLYSLPQSVFLFVLVSLICVLFSSPSARAPPRGPALSSSASSVPLPRSLGLFLPTPTGPLSPNLRATPHPISSHFLFPCGDPLYFFIFSIFREREKCFCIFLTEGPSPISLQSHDRTWGGGRVCVYTTGGWRWRQTRRRAAGRCARSAPHHGSA